MPLNHSSIYAELTEKHFNLIGRFVIEWSNIEHLLRVVLTRLLLTPDFPGRVYTDELNVHRIQNAIINAAELHQYRYRYQIIPQKTITQVLDLNDKATSLRSLRNKFAHFCWSRTSNEEIFGINISGALPLSKKHSKSYIKITIKELESAYKEVYELVDKLSSLIDKLPEVEESKKLLKTMSKEVL